MRRLFHPRSRRGVILMLMTVMVPFLLVPAAGLAIDATIIHIVQIKLQGAVDAAALGAGRLLGTPANIKEIAGEFFKANFTVGGRGFWNSTLPGDPTLNPYITYDTGITKVVTVNASADVPTLFMRIFGYTTAHVSAIGQASRRDARIMFIIDRSGSMNFTTDSNGKPQPITTVVSQVQSLIQMFTPTLDEIGLIAFDSTGVVGYPSTTTYDPTVGIVNSPGVGGPDVCFWDSTKPSGNSSYGLKTDGTCGSTGTPDSVYQTGKVTAKGGTGMADALSLAYAELQKAHLRDLKANGGTDFRTNAILLFTDGVPSAMSAFANDPNHGGPWINSGSGCTNYNNGASAPIQFWMAVSGSPTYSSISTSNNQIASQMISSTNTPLWFMSNPYSSVETNTPTTNEGGSNCQNNLNNLNLTQIPGSDMWGNSSSANTDSGHAGYRDSCFMNGTGGCSTSQCIYCTGTGQGDIRLNGSTCGNTGSSSCVQSGYQWGLAMWDNVDNAALKIRTDANYSNRGESSAMSIQILTIGYSGDGGTDAGLLKRVANDPNDTSSPYDLPLSWSTQPQGKFCLAPNLAALENCMNIMASILLHLTK